MTEEKRKVRSVEERREAMLKKVEELERKIQNKEVRKVWVSLFRQKKSELNKNKDLDYTAKIQAFVDWIADETNIEAYTDSEENEDEEEDEE